MSIKNKDRKARKAYKKKIETVRVELYPTDLDIKIQIANRIVKGEKKTTYIKRLIREDIKRANGKNGNIVGIDEMHELPCDVSFTVSKKLNTTVIIKRDGAGGEN